ncbi:TPA: hypothetical protein ACXPX8_005677, partial [Klebsiella variicola subsp. variicola]
TQVFPGSTLLQTDHSIYPIAPLFCRVALHLPDQADAPTVKRDSRWLSFLFGDGMPRCRVIFIQHGSRICAGGRLTPYPAYDPGTLSLIYSPFLLKLPVLAASTSLRRSR